MVHLQGLEPWTHCICHRHILPCEEIIHSLDNQRNGICKAYPERQIQRQLLMYEVRLVEQGLLVSGSLSGRRRKFSCCFATFSVGTATLLALRSSVSHGSNSRLGCYSLPLPFESLKGKNKNRPHTVVCHCFGAPPGTRTLDPLHMP